MESSWRNDFDRFLGVVTRRIRYGEAPSDLSEEFTGEKVRWAGTLRRKSLEFEAPTVHIGPPRTDLDLGDDPYAKFAGLTLPVADESIAAWDRLAIGAKVTFTATLGARMGIFPTIEVSHLPENLTLLSIRLIDAAPV